MSAEPRHRSAFDVAREIWLPATILSCAAILLRLLVATRREGIEIDGITYLMNMQAMTGDWSAVNLLHPPLYSMLLAVFHPFWSDAEWGARVVSAVAGGLWVWPALWLASETTTARVQWPVGLLVALNPSAVDAGTRVLTEPLFGLCLTVLLIALLRTIKTQSWPAAGLAGVTGGLATLTRPEGMGYLLFVWAVLALAPVLLGKQWAWRKAALVVGLVTAVWFTVLFPYVLAVRQATGQWHWSGKAGVTLRWSESVGQERSQAFLEQVITESSGRETSQGIGSYLLDRPVESLQRVVLNLHLMDKYTLPGLLHTGGLALAVLGLACLRYRPEGSWEWFLVAALVPLAGLLLFVVEARYFVSAIPVLSVVSGIGLARLPLRSRNDSDGGPSGLAMLLLAAVLASFAPWVARPWFREDPSAVEKRAGLWLRQTEGGGAVLVGRYPRVAYYAGATAVPFSPRPLDGLLVEAREQGGRFLIADSTVLPVTRPDLLMLTAGTSGRSDLELIHIEEDRAGRRVVVYRIHPERR
jgi:4-amino-4-deoxy-L-arabinose transferase-like glycosyltransferase